MAGAHTPYDFLTYVWSDLFDLHLEFAGDESEHDHVIVRGAMSVTSLTLFVFEATHADRVFRGQCVGQRFSSSPARNQAAQERERERAAASGPINSA